MKFYRTNQTFKVLSVYLAMTIMFPQAVIFNSFALTGGPSQPEFNSFTPIGTSDMVNLSSGDFNYNIPIMDVGGYPLNLAYNSGITMDQEASWVGLGWNLNVGQIKRTVRGLPDDFDGDKMTYENNFKPNWTIGSHFGLGKSVFGAKELLGAKVGLGVQYNNYNGITFNPTVGITFQLSNSCKLGLDISGSVAGGATVSPSVSLSGKLKKNHDYSVSGSLGMTINSRQAISSVNIGASLKMDDHCPDDVISSPELGVGGAIINYNNSVLFTPTKRVASQSSNFTFNAAVGGTAFGISGQVKVNGYGSLQSINDDEKHKEVSAFGYENTEKNELKNKGILDFNREKDRSFNDNTIILPLTNYTYDMYNIDGQGVSGAFRPYRSQIGFVNDLTVKDKGTGVNFGVEAELGWIFAFGVDIKVTDTESHSGLWGKDAKNYALKHFTNDDANNIDYEKIFYKNQGQLNIDDYDEGLYSETLNGEDPLNIAIGGRRYKRSLETDFNKFTKSDDEKIWQSSSESISDKIKREKRLIRNQSVQKVTAAEVSNFEDNFFERNPLAKDHHTAGFNILKTDGSKYVYGKTAYNKIKKEVTFAVDNKGDCTSGLVSYDVKSVNDVNVSDNTINNSRGVDEYFNSTTTPAYAHSYLLTSILSADYEDKTGDGPTNDDFGAYTKFNYSPSEDYNWRVPYEEKTATFNKGLYSHPEDQKGNYVYGEREQVYIESIETKTHIALFELSARKDGYGVKNENGGQSNELTSKKINKITLYSIEDYFLDSNRETVNVNAIPIKTAHFLYDYSQCKDLPNNILKGESPTADQLALTKNIELANQGGKLTLKKVYFTYQNSNMGAHMPYEFKYGQIDANEDGEFDQNDLNEISNPEYDIKGYDIWGSYKEKEDENASDCDLNAAPTNSEFPYTLQDNQLNADKNTVAWTLTSIGLPSGGDMNIHFESDDYQFVQNKEVMQLYNVTGCGMSSGESGDEPSSDEVKNTNLYNDFIGGTWNRWDNKYLYIKIPENQKNNELNDFIKGLDEEPILFKFLLNMTDNSNQYDYVSGYFNFSKTRGCQKFSIGEDHYISIPMDFIALDGKSNDTQVNPISKAGMYFGRSNMNQIVYSIGGVHKNFDPISVVEDLIGSIGTIFEIGQGPNKTLRDKSCASKFKPKKSWVRLLNPTKKKFGGGTRVKRLQMNDNWDVMTDNDGDSLYQKFYGQIYSYTNEDEEETSSGVATFEPNGSRENPFVIPLYDKTPKGADKILAPQESNFVEKPIGESFYPSPSITYGRVTVKNIAHDDITKHATGKIVNTFYTSHDFPTITKHSELDDKNVHFDKASTIANFLNFSVKNHVTASQGFVIERNDMNGKPKGEWIYAEDKLNINTNQIETPFLSGVEYKYEINADGSLNNKVPVIHNNGNIETKLVGVNYEVINDFRENSTAVTTVGVNTNVSGFLVWIFPLIVPLPIPNYSRVENTLRTSVTTKVIQKHGLLEEKIAYDLGAKVSTKNLAWDANTAQVLVTETVNSYHDEEDLVNKNDNKYYSINYPAYWKYDRMGPASQNLDIEATFTQGTDNLFELENASDYLQPGDVLNATYNVATETINKKLWVLSVTGNNVVLMDREGLIINDSCTEEEKTSSIAFKIIRSGYRNLQQASMASITSKINPIVEDDGTSYRTTLASFYNVDPVNAKIINASAVEYSDFWKPVNENENKYFIATDETDTITATELATYDTYNTNPYIYNIRGDWRAKKSWAYLTGRYQEIDDSDTGETKAIINTREDGYLTSFTPFYRLNNNVWEVNEEATNIESETKWTFASEVTQYAPYGVELENKDALDRYSSAQYGYKYTLPTAVASNTQYKEIGFDGFEDYDDDKEANAHFSFSNTDNVTATNSEAHTGRKSIAVTSNSSVSLIKPLVDVNPEEIVDCPVKEKPVEDPDPIENPDPVPSNGCITCYSFTVEVKEGESKKVIVKTTLVGGASFTNCTSTGQILPQNDSLTITQTTTFSVGIQASVHSNNNPYTSIIYISIEENGGTLINLSPIYVYHTNQQC